MSNIVGIEEIMQETGLSRKYLTSLLNMKGCPVLPRKKGQHYRILKGPFMEWLTSQVKK